MNDYHSDRVTAVIIHTSRGELQIITLCTTLTTSVTELQSITLTTTLTLLSHLTSPLRCPILRARLSDDYISAFKRGVELEVKRNRQKNSGQKSREKEREVKSAGMRANALLTFLNVSPPTQEHQPKRKNETEGGASSAKRPR